MKVSELFEGKRQKGINYTEVKAKKKGAEQVVEKVIAELKGKDSGAWTRLTKQYIDLDDKLKDLTIDRNKLNDEIKAEAADIFDAADDVLTRVIETAQLTLTLSKKTKKPETTEVDHEKVVAGLLASKLTPAISKMLDELIKANSKIIEASEVPEKLTVKRNKVDEGFSFGSLKTWLANIVGKLRSLIKDYDEKFDAVKAQVAAL